MLHVEFEQLNEVFSCPCFMGSLVADLPETSMRFSLALAPASWVH